jgi:hypothetical protein
MRMEGHSCVVLTSSNQGPTLVHFSAQRKHILWNTFGAWFSPSLLDRGTDTTHE